MIAKLDTADAAFQESVTLLLRLHRMTLAGQDQTKEADALRDEMEAPWYCMSAGDRIRVDELSADLYSIGHGLTAPANSPSTPADLADDIRELSENNDWDGILKRIRELESSLDPRDNAYARGICWAHLGMPSVAVEFLIEASRLRSLSAEEEALLLTCYVHAGRATEVLGRAQEIQANSRQRVLLLKAAEIFSLIADESIAENADHDRQAAIDCAERAFAAEAETPVATDTEGFDSLVLSGLLHLALNYEQTGNREKAVEACRRALAIFPENLDALMLYGFFVFDKFPDAHRIDFIESRRSQMIGASFDRLLAVPSFSSLSN